MHAIGLLTAPARTCFRSCAKSARGSTPLFFFVMAAYIASRHAEACVCNDSLFFSSFFLKLSITRST